MEERELLKLELAKRHLAEAEKNRDSSRRAVVRGTGAGFHAFAAEAQQDADMYQLAMEMYRDLIAVYEKGN